MNNNNGQEVQKKYEYDQSGNIKSEAEYLGNELHGTSKYFSWDGTTTIGSWSHGKRHGVWTKLNEFGQTCEHVYWYEGKRIKYFKKEHQDLMIAFLQNIGVDLTAKQKIKKDIKNEFNID